ncbi:Glycerophosphodiester phosphodiesterase domain-containing protein 5 [Anas platyrhynchos]|uniref:Glycerophosphodiester phosphodiesterase domain-containing protein 5 n=1 Tax=Anas platyrhynchos TaxID=8839 RepID=R0L0D4_ANAPL|nr:Glycerophosphodiester phosphodiesterase domain-containing protein 5 [Anas platyrhynchos]
MVKHQPLQYYEPQLCLSCLTGIYGCRWKRYQRSHDDTTKHSLAKQKGLNFVLKRLSYFCGCCPEAVKLVKPQDKAWGRGKQVERQVNKTELFRWFAKNIPIPDCKVFPQALLPNLHELLIPGGTGSCLLRARLF